MSLGVGFTSVVLVTGEGLLILGWVIFVELLILLDRCAEDRHSICGGGLSCLVSKAVAAAVEVGVQRVRRRAILGRQ